MEKLESRTIEAVRGALNKQKRTNRPRFSDIDWPRTIRSNLRHWQPAYQTIVPERLVGFGRHARRSNLEDVILCVDQSGSMATSVVYSSIFAAVLASIPAIATRLVVYDTAVVDLTEDLKDPVEVLFRRPARRRQRHATRARLLRNAHLRAGQDAFRTGVRPL